MGKKKVVIDTYALLAIAYGEVGNNAVKVLEEIRRGNVVGLLPQTVVYEYIVH